MLFVGATDQASLTNPKLTLDKTVKMVYNLYTL